VAGGDTGARSWLKLSGLTYALFVFSVPVLGRSPWPIWALTAASLAIFAILYLDFLEQHARSRQRAGAGLAAMAALGFAAMPFNVAAAAYIVYVAALAPFILRPQQSIAVMIGLAGGIAIELLLLTGPDRLIVGGWLIFLILIVGGGNLFVGDRARQKALIRQAREDVEEMAKLAERERIARDLHDLLGHTLSVIALKAELASKLADSDPPRAAKEIREVESVSRDALREVRAAVEGYKSRGLSGEMKSAAAALAAAGVRLDVRAESVPCSPRQEAVLALALRETVTNVVRHAQAAACRIALSGDGQRAMLTVEDDGVGRPIREGHGLAGMRERVAAAGGTVEIDTSRGVTVRISVPTATP
jgi:two-component system sensor histidine kinase DesK